MEISLNNLAETLHIMNTLVMHFYLQSVIIIYIYFIYIKHEQSESYRLNLPYLVIC